MKRKKLALVAVGLALGFGAAAGAARSGLLGTLAIGGNGHPAASGIKVHGKWTLVVRNKHGKVVTRRRFENALTPSGQCVLTSLLLGGTLHGFSQVPCQWRASYNGGHNYATSPGVVGAQAIQLDDGTAPASFKGCNFIINVNLCFLQHYNGDASDVSGPAPVGDGPLHVTANGSSLTLNASVTLPTATTYRAVSTLLKVCGTYYAGPNNHEQDPHDCATISRPDEAAVDYAWVTFTSKTLATPLTVAANQSLAVTVQLSFS